MIAALIMALTVGALDRSLHVGSDRLPVLVGAGLASYVALCCCSMSPGPAAA